MDSGAGETRPEQLLDQTIRHCHGLFIAKKERLDRLVTLCTMISGRLGDHSLTSKRSDYDDLKSKLVEVEGQLAVWSNYNFFRKLINRRSIKEGITVFIRDLESIITDVQDHTPHGTPENHPVRDEQPPTIRLLNGVVTKQGEIAFAEGRSCHVWMGQWNNNGGENGNGEEIGKEGAGTMTVALKVLKPPQPPQGKAGKAKRVEEEKRALEELEQELVRWGGIRHPNILPFYGIVTDIEKYPCMVFPWRENGHLLNYVKEHPQADKYHLLRGSAAGLRYLHEMKYVHGNVRCNNVLVTHEGEPQICDFGIAKVFHRSHENTVSKTKSTATDVRYAAPELIEHNDFPATVSSDTYSFGLLILECITQAPPFSNLGREAEIIHARISSKKSPPRPEGENSVRDDLWDLMNRCWSSESDQRPSMNHVHQFFLERA